MNCIFPCLIFCLFYDSFASMIVLYWWLRSIIYFLKKENSTCGRLLCSLSFLFLTLFLVPLPSRVLFLFPQNEKCQASNSRWFSHASPCHFFVFLLHLKLLAWTLKRLHQSWKLRQFLSIQQISVTCQLSVRVEISASASAKLRQSKVIQLGNSFMRQISSLENT